MKDFPVIDKDRECPRCNGNNFIEDETYDQFTCKHCENVYVYDYRFALFSIEFNGYEVFWYKDNTCAVYAPQKSLNMMSNIDEWLPPDITEEQIKVYLTFS